MVATMCTCQGHSQTISKWSGYNSAMHVNWGRKGEGGGGGGSLMIGRIALQCCCSIYIFNVCDFKTLAGGCVMNPLTSH